MSNVLFDPKMQDFESKRNRCFSDTFVTTVPKANLYAYVHPAKKSALVDEAYYSRCCCHITRWVYIIAAVEIVALLISMVVTIIQFASHPHYLEYPLEDFIIALVATCVSGLAIAFLVVGVHLEKYSFLIPHMICQILSIIGLVIAIIIYGVRAGTDKAHWETEKDENEAKKAQVNYDYVVAVIILCVSALVAEAGFYAQVSKCYRYLKSRKVRRMHLVRRRSSI